MHYLKSILSISLIFSSFLLFSQNSNADFKPSGKAFGLVYFNYHQNFTSGATQKSAFEIQRAYLGYDYQISKEISTKIILNVGKDDVSDYTYYLKIAELDWKLNPKLTLSFGIIGSKLMDTQDKHWGYGYIVRPYQDLYGLGATADLGANAAFLLHKNILLNIFVTNGDGYKKAQDANGDKNYGFSLVVNPIEKVVLKGYFDSMDKNGVHISKTILYAGYEQKDHFRINVEYSLLKNGSNYNTAMENSKLGGFSFFGAYTLNAKWEIFGRFDQISSNKLNNSLNTWNYLNDGNSLITGFQYIPIKGVKTALNLETFNFDDLTKPTNSAVYLNFEYKF